MVKGMRDVRSVMIFAERPAEVAQWYSEELGLGGTELMPDGAAIVADGVVELVFHPADRVKNPPGASTVVYWQSDDVRADLTLLMELGARIHRGPLVVSDTRSICQLTDPGAACSASTASRRSDFSCSWGCGDARSSLARSVCPAVQRRGHPNQRYPVGRVVHCPPMATMRAARAAVVVPEMSRGRVPVVFQASPAQVPASRTAPPVTAW